METLPRENHQQAVQTLSRPALTIHACGIITVILAAGIVNSMYMGTCMLTTFDNVCVCVCVCVA